MDIVFHYPPELMSLLIEAIPRLCRSKRDVLLLFVGAGVPEQFLSDLSAKVDADRGSVTKYEIVRTVLTRLNERGESTLRERREVVRRVTEWEDFSTCWSTDELKAKGLVAEIRRVVDVKDSFTRMRQEREAERDKHIAAQRAKALEMRRRRKELAAIKDDLFALFPQQDRQQRGRDLEGILNRLFRASEIHVRESFSLRGSSGEGTVEQIDGVVQIDGHYYLVEMKWYEKSLGTGEVAQHLVQIHHRDQARGILISASRYTPAAVTMCKEALSKTVVVLCYLEEIVRLLEQEGDLQDFLRSKIEAAVVRKEPLYEALTRNA